MSADQSSVDAVIASAKARIADLFAGANEPRGRWEINRILHEETQLAGFGIAFFVTMTFDYSPPDHILIAGKPHPDPNLISIEWSH